MISKEDADTLKQLSTEEGSMLRSLKLSNQFIFSTSLEQGGQGVIEVISCNPSQPLMIL